MTKRDLTEVVIGYPVFVIGVLALALNFFEPTVTLNAWALVIITFNTVFGGYLLLSEGEG